MGTSVSPRLCSSPCAAETDFLLSLTPPPFAPNPIAWPLSTATNRHDLHYKCRTSTVRPYERYHNETATTHTTTPYTYTPDSRPRVGVDKVLLRPPLAADCGS